MDAKEILRTVFGYNEFREPQGEIISHVIQGNDALVLMPTGGGKSLCYQIPALVRRGTGIVISPLISLMQDQVEALLQYNVRAAFLNSALDATIARQVEKNFLENKLDLLYVAPERLLTPRFLDLLSEVDVALFAIDEAHCVSQWGHDFRPEYVQLSVLHERFPHVPRIALTATADDPTRREIATQLALTKAKHFISSFDRPNIQYRIIQKKNPREQLFHFLETEHAGDAGIVYCFSRKRVDEVAAALQDKGLTALPYHAGLPTITRQKNQMRFLQEEGVIIVATVAFGMGIDKPNVRFVAHIDLPKSMEGYYQETGRAGRDGLPATAWMTYGLSDVISLRHLIMTSEGGNEQFIQLEKRKLESLLGFCETTLCRRSVMLNYFGESYAGPCGNCDNCLTPIETWDGKTAAQMALSCIYRTGQRFGMKHLIDVLLGKLTDQVIRFNHDKVSTFGIGKEFTNAQWQSIFRQLVAANLVAVDVMGFGGFSLTEKCGPILRGEQTIAFRKELERIKKKKVVRGKKESLLIPSDELWSALKTKRLELAKKQGVPPYIIFHDSTLVEIHSVRPKDLVELQAISGVGENKLRRYGDEFIAVIREFV